MTSERNMKMRNLAEAIILQSVEDLWDVKQKGECLTFFSSEGFSICAEIAGMTECEQMMMLKLVSASAKETSCDAIPPRRLKGHAYSVSGRR